MKGIDNMSEYGNGNNVAFLRSQGLPFNDIESITQCNINRGRLTT